MSVVVFGANGFIGSALTQALITQGLGVETVTSASNSTDVIRKLNPASKTTLVWAASKVNPINANTDRDLVHKESMAWSQFLDTFVDYGLAKNSRILLLSSGGCTYDGVDSPFNETAPSSGVNEYGRLKLEMERELQSRDIHKIVFAYQMPSAPTN